MNTLLEIPRSKPAAAPTRFPAHASRRILVVEDDDAIRQCNTRVLMRSGYQVDAAEDGAAGWEALHANNFDLLLTDHDMPRLSGLQLVGKVRRAGLTLPVILASGSLHTEQLEREPWLQVAVTLLKPLLPHQLLQAVNEVLRASHQACFGPEGCCSVSVNTFRHRMPHEYGTITTESPAFNLAPAGHV